MFFIIFSFGIYFLFVNLLHGFYVADTALVSRGQILRMVGYSFGIYLQKRFFQDE